MLSPFSPGTKAKNYGSSGCPGSYPTVQSLNSRYLSSALFLLPCFRLSFSSIQPNAIFSFLTSYMSPWCFSIPSISSVLGLSTPPPAPSTPWGLPTFSSCLCHGGSCCWAEYWWGHNIWKIDQILLWICFQIQNFCTERYTSSVLIRILPQTEYNFMEESFPHISTTSAVNIKMSRHLLTQTVSFGFITQN